MDIDLDLELGINFKMQTLSMNDIICQSLEEDTMDETDELETNEMFLTDSIISDMYNLSIDEKNELMCDLFDNNLDVYSIYSEIIDTNKIQPDPINYPIDYNIDNYSTYDNKYNKYNILRVIGVPNIYCDSDNFDDEDFIYYLFKLPEHLSYLVRNDNTVEDIDGTLINFADTTISPEIVYFKILYIYQFVHYYYTSLSTLPLKKRINHLPHDYLLWVYNIIDIIRKTINIENMYSSLCIYQNDKTTIYDNYDNYDSIENKEKYFKDLVYGLSLCICHLKMILNYNQTKNIYFWDMEQKYIDKLFRILNNLCIIVIYMKHGL